MYCYRNFKTKKALKDAVAKGDRVEFFQPGPFNNYPRGDTIYVKGPHYPEPHKWYATCKVKDGVIVNVK